jgi:Putative prokaryotic signal transducing protein
MHILVQTTNAVLISYVESLLSDAGIDVFVFDANMSVVEGSIGVFPRRIMVADGDTIRARTILVGAGLADELSQAPGP